MKNPALHMFQQMWGQEFCGHPRFYELLLELAKLHTNKNQDYGGTEQHPFQVYKESAEIGMEPWRAALSRLSEKWARLKTFAKKEIYKVDDETFVDTLKDMAVISLIVLILYEEQEYANKKAVFAKARTGNEPGNRSCTDERSNKLNAAFQAGYQEENPRPSHQVVSKVPKHEPSGHDGSSTGLGQPSS